MNIIGHKRIINLLDRSVEKRIFSQAYIFSGPESVGKLLVAKNFAKKLIGGDTESGVNPDLIVISPEIKEKKGVAKESVITIKEVRKLKKELSLSAYYGKNKVLIVNDAHKLNISAQNAFLKTIEEPFESSVIILITHKEEKLLPTIKSRCQKIKFGLVSLEEMTRGIEKMGEKIENNLIIFSMGKPGEVIEMSESPEKLESRKEDFLELKKLFSSSVKERIDLAEKYSRNEPEATARIEFWIWMLRIQAYKKIKEKKEVKRIFEAIESLTEGVEIIKDTNANSRLVLENLIINL